MKRATEPTACILLKAFTQSEWDTCDFAVISIHPKWRSVMRNRLRLLALFKNDPTFLSHHYCDSHKVFFINDEGEGNANATELLEESEDWCFVETHAKELASLPVPQTRLDGITMVLEKDGHAHFTAYGKYTGEEFWTADFNILQLIKNLNNDTV